FYTNSSSIPFTSPSSSAVLNGVPRPRRLRCSTSRVADFRQHKESSMCGITGGWWSAPPLDLERRLAASLHALRLRGPNDRDCCSMDAAGGRLALGHTRLSIIDLSDQARQPMVSPCGRYRLIFNGEIYNYRELRRELESLGRAF